MSQNYASIGAISKDEAGRPFVDFGRSAMRFFTRREAWKLLETMILVIGEILLDELPTGNRPGGAPFNVAQHLTRLGLDARFVSRVGFDRAGEELIAAARSANLPTQLIQRDEDHPTGRVEVQVDTQGIPSYNIIPGVAYDFIELDDLGDECALADLVCYGSLIQRTEAGRKRLQKFLAQQPYGTVHLYDMNLRAGCHEKAIILSSLETCDVLKLNDDELLETARITGSSLKEDELVEQLMTGFNIRQVALTRGAKGSVLYADGQRLEQSAGFIGAEDIVDTVGAGDSFTAMLATGLYRGWPPEKTLRMASRLSEQLCTIAGAVPRDDSFYQPFANEL